MTERFTQAQRTITARALIDYCMISGKIRDFTLAAKVCELIGAPQAAAIIEDRRDIFRKLRPVAFEKIACRENNSKFFVRAGA